MIIIKNYNILKNLLIKDIKLDNLILITSKIFYTQINFKMKTKINNKIKKIPKLFNLILNQFKININKIIMGNIKKTSLE
jgi:hypothetical protein